MMKVYTRALLHRVVKPTLWRWFGNKRASQLSDTDFRSLFPHSKNPEGFIQDFHEAVRLRFFFHPRNQKDFFLHLLTQSQPYEEILADAQDVLANQYDALGSGKTFLGETINWRKDFKSGKEWPLRPLSADEIIDAGNHSDIKLVWELNRFHQALWLGKAYWLTHNDEYARKFGALVDAWINENPPGRGPNWFGAMEVAIRACNWIAGYYFFCESKSLTNEFWIRFLKSLTVHGLFIENHLEYSKRNGNHLLSDIAGLVMLGIFFRSSSFGQRWLAWGVTALQEEMDNQVYPDGVDYEKSIGYHRFVLELFYSVTVICQKNNIPLRPEFMKRLETMFEFTLAYTRPDGTAPNVGDADDGRLFRFSPREDFNGHRDTLSVGSVLFRRSDFRSAAGPFAQNTLWLLGAESFEWHQMLHPVPSSPSSLAFPEGRYYIMRSGEAHLFVDAGDLGMRGRGGHGHNDTFSFELWCDGSPLIVDSGTFVYTAEIGTRQEFRGTSSHNTLMIDKAELAEFAGLWSVKRDDTRVRVLKWETRSECDILEVEHSAYTRLPDPVRVQRRFEFKKEPFSVVITDTLEGNASHLVESFLHFAPGVSIDVTGPQKAVARKGNAQYIVSVSGGVLAVSDTWYSSSYGLKERKKTLNVTQQAQFPTKLRLHIGRGTTA